MRFAVDGIPAFALGGYDGALRRAVVAMKRGERDPLDVLADLLAARAPLHETLVPLATTRERAAQRGFDQSVQLARLLAMRRSIGCAEVLVKHGRPQAGQGRRVRLAAAGRFRLRSGVALPQAATLLDDVCTTTATLRDAAHVLRAAGVDVRQIVVLARAGGTPGTQMRS